MIFGNDSRLVQDRLIVENDATRDGILAQKVHVDSYTVTLYVLLKDYGLTPVFRIKPRIASIVLTTITSLQAHPSGIALTTSSISLS